MEKRKISKCLLISLIIGAIYLIYSAVTTLVVTISKNKYKKTPHQSR